MRSQLLVAFTLLSAASASLVPAAKVVRALEYVVKPKVFIVSMFDPEADIWYGIPEFDILALNITVPGFSPLFPDAHCTADGDICQLVTGESGKIYPSIQTNRSRSLQSLLQRSMQPRRYQLSFTQDDSTLPRHTSW